MLERARETAGIPEVLGMRDRPIETSSESQETRERIIKRIRRLSAATSGPGSDHPLRSNVTPRRGNTDRENTE
jgi:hypothetical protein